MRKFFKKIYKIESFYPSWLIGIWINPAFIVRRGILKGVKNISSKFIGGKLLDVGCGSKPYELLFDVEEYIGIDVEISGHNHLESKIDKFYDGIHIPFDDKEFNWVFSSEVFEHVFNLDQLLIEVNRVLLSGGKLAFTCPFVWEEHEQPYDFARYSSFALLHIMEKNGFKVESLHKSTSYFETVMQLFSMYIYQNCLPNNKYLKILFVPFFVSPFNILGSLLGGILPKNSGLYHSNIVVAVKK
jgi:ubiquinone/menaquinone biosynthesis C-methylase UbiE